MLDSDVSTVMMPKYLGVNSRELLMFLRSLTVAAFTLLLQLNIYAQSFQIGGGSGYTPRFPMLMSKAVQEELKLTEEQTKKIQAKIKEQFPEGSMMRMPSGEKGGEEGAPRVMMSFSFKAGNGAAPPVGGGIAFDPGSMPIPPVLPDFKKIDEEVIKLLEQPQRDRLRQITLQRTGLSALGQEDVAKDIELDAEQRDMVKHILDDQRKKGMEHIQKMIASGGGIQQDQVSTFMKKLREQTESDLGLILTPEQQTKWEEIKGPKFDKK